MNRFQTKKLIAKRKAAAKARRVLKSRQLFALYGAGTPSRLVETMDTYAAFAAERAAGKTDLAEAMVEKFKRSYPYKLATVNYEEIEKRMATKLINDGFAYLVHDEFVREIDPKESPEVYCET